jgi:hypothetical protein
VPIAMGAGNSQMSDDQQDTVSSKASVFGLLDEAPMTTLHYYWLLASGGTLLDGFSVVSLGIAIPLLKQEMNVTPVLVGLHSFSFGPWGGARSDVGRNRR